MTEKKECIAMLLAGGQGSRLYALTTRTAKPAVSFGGKYRIIDFTLSNCVNSGIDTVGVLTQYQPLMLNDYIGNGLPWDLDRNSGGVKILPPYQGHERSDWYRGTANAIYQNMEFIDRYDPDYVLVLSGDHIYKMDYGKMLAFHKQKNADCTIAVLNVPIEEASRFGIMTTDGDGNIIRFSEKPKHPESTLASMGIYIFTRDVLKKYLHADDADENSQKDFGKNVIPAMLAGGVRMTAYPFEGYWKDVGTIDSLWEANMDLLGKNPVLNVNEDNWRIFSRHYAVPPQYTGESAQTDNSVITEGCRIYGKVKNSVLGTCVTVESGAVVCDSVIMSGTVIGRDAVVRNAIIDSDCHIGARASVGEDRSKSAKITVLGRGVTVEADRTIEAGDMLSAE